MKTSWRRQRRSSMMTMTMTSLLVMLGVGMMAMSKIPAASAQTPSDPPVSIAKFVEDTEQLSTLRTMLQGLGISPSDAQTLLALNNAAFDRWKTSDPIMYHRYSKDAFFIHRRLLMLWHFVDEDVLTQDQIFDGARTKLQNMVGEINVRPVQQTLDGVPRAAMVATNRAMTDGMVHVLNQIIIPPMLHLPMLDRMFRDFSDKFSFNVMANIALFAGLKEELNKIYEDGLTFLVPPNRRFNRAEIDVPTLLHEDSKDYTRAFVLCHMLPGNQFFDTVKARHAAKNTEQDFIVTMLGTHIWITTTDEKFRFQSSEVLLQDQVTKNGVFHGLDMPLAPPKASDFANFMRVSTSWDTEPCNRMFVASAWTSETFAQLANDTVSVFCPDDAAFAAFDRAVYDRLIEPEWQRHLRDFLSHHISSPAMTIADYYAEAPGNITMLSGETYQLKRKGTSPRIDKSVIQFGDMISTDGYFHIIDKVLEPPSVSRTLYDHCKESNRTYSGLTLFATTVDYVRLTDLIDRDLPLTGFIPYNRAFRRISYPAPKARGIVEQHVIRGLYYIDVVAKSTILTPLEGFDMGVEVKYDNVTMEESVWVGGAKIIQEEVYTRNGVMHVIDRVIGFDYETSPPTVSPAPTMTAQPTA